MLSTTQGGLKWLTFALPKVNFLPVGEYFIFRYHFNMVIQVRQTKCALLLVFSSHFLFQIFDLYLKGLRGDFVVMDTSMILKSYDILLFYLNTEIIARVE